MGELTEASLHGEAERLGQGGEVQGYKDLSSFIYSVTVVADDGPGAESTEHGRTIRWRLD